MDREDRQRLIERMGEAVHQTRVAYQRAKEDFHRIPESDLQGPDGKFTFDQALVRERQAFAAAKRALFDYNRFVIDGKIPGRD